MTAKIIKISASEILDSRGNPTVEVEVQAEVTKSFFSTKVIKAWAQVPSGSSTGKYEAYELRDDNSKRFGGKGVQKAVENVNAIIQQSLLGLDPINQLQIDTLMNNLDGSGKKYKLGANAILGVSMAVARLGAMIRQESLYEYIAHLVNNKKPNTPRPFFNVINGGVHAGNDLAFQEFMISPKLGSFEDNYRAGAEIYHTLKYILKEKYGGEATLLGDEGGFAPAGFTDPKDALDLLVQAVKEAGYEGRVDFALDVAASEFFENEKYNLGIKSGVDDYKTVDQMIEIYLNLVKKYPIISIEDPFDENDFDSFSKLKEKMLGKKVKIVGDDLTVTNPHRIKTAIQKDSCDTLLLKINQIGTISEALDAFREAKTASWEIMVSHRSGETIDDFIADFSTGIGAEYIKSGAPARGERVVKYNRLLSIFRKLAKNPLYETQKYTGSLN